MANTELNWILSEYCPSNGLVLDAGCGDLVYSKLLENLGAHVLSLDIKDYNYLESKKSNFIIGSIENLPFGDNSFDMIICFSVLQYIKNDSKILLDFGRVLKKEGILYVFSSRSIIPKFTTKCF